MDEIDLSQLPIDFITSVLQEANFEQEKIDYEGSLLSFLRDAWPNIENAEFQENWAIEAIAEHLEAVVWGQIKRLLINCPPRTGKTSITSICWPAWTWAQRDITYLSGPQVKFLCGSYNDRLSLINSNKVRRLIT